MNKYLVVTTGAVAFGLASVAAAADAVSPTPFSGLYVGASGGYDIQSNDNGSVLQFDRTGAGKFNDPVLTAGGANAFAPGFCHGRAQGPTFGSPGCENDRNRGSYYGRVGFNKQYGHLVLGVVGEFGKTGIKDYTSGYSITPASYVFERGVNYEGMAALRGGLAFDTTMFYAVGGVGYADIRHRFFTTNTANAFSDNGNARKAGFIAGVGLEKFLTRHVTFGVEYSYHDYKDKNYRVLVSQGTALATNPFVLAPSSTTVIRRSDDNFRWNSLSATVGYHF